MRGLHEIMPVTAAHKHNQAATDEKLMDYLCVFFLKESLKTPARFPYHCAVISSKSVSGPKNTYNQLSSILRYIWTASHKRHVSRMAAIYFRRPQYHPWYSGENRTFFSFCWKWLRLQRYWQEFRSTRYCCFLSASWSIFKGLEAAFYQTTSIFSWKRYLHR